MQLWKLLFGLGIGLESTAALAADWGASIWVPLIASAVSGAATVYSAQQTGKATMSAAKAGAKASAPMPQSNDEAVAAARRRQIAAMQVEGGRASTILSQDDRLGG